MATGSGTKLSPDMLSDVSGVDAVCLEHYELLLQLKKKSINCMLNHNSVNCTSTEYVRKSWSSIDGPALSVLVRLKPVAMDWILP